jgi:chromosome segregation protein
MESLKARQTQAETALEALKLDVLSASEATLGLRRRLNEAESSWSHQEASVRSSLRELERDLRQAETARGEIEAARQALTAQEAQTSAIKTESEAAETDAKRKREDLNALSEETMRLHSDMAQSQARLEAIEAQGGQNPYWTGAQAVLNAGLPGVLGTVRQLFKVTDEAYKPFVEDVLGERLYAIVCEDSAAARAAIELLEGSGRGRARFLVLSSLPGQLSERAYPDEAKPLLKHIEFDPKHERVLRFLLGESYTLGKTLFGDHWVGQRSDPAEFGRRAGSPREGRSSQDARGGIGGDQGLRRVRPGASRGALAAGGHRARRAKRARASAARPVV